jgi:hypothetical protein
MRELEPGFDASVVAPALQAKNPNALRDPLMKTLVAALLALSALFLSGSATQDPQLTLADDGRVGTVLDRQGTALVRPVGRQRWTPLGPRSLLMPGDLVRTPVRGAHAVEMQLAGGGVLLLGPGGLAESPKTRFFSTLSPTGYFPEPGQACD